MGGLKVTDVKAVVLFKPIMEDNKLNRNSLAFVGAATEYCSLLEHVAEYDKDEFISAMLRLLPRLYIMMSDYKRESHDTDGAEFDAPGFNIQEEQYEQVRSAVAVLLGEDDTYLETFEQDMKYSETPIAANISEGLADIYQDLCNFLIPVRDSGGVLAENALEECHDNFVTYWAQTLVNVMRPINHLQYRY